MDSKEMKQQIRTAILLSVYLIILTWIILFKMQFSIKDLDRFNSINLIPFKGSVIVNNKIELSEIYDNVLVFIPFGLYMCMLKTKWPFLKKVLPIIGVSLCYEVMQYILKIGASDITDIIGNTLGGVIGIAAYLVLHKLFKTDIKTNKILNTVALICTICIILFLGFLITCNS